jgi:Holliday junction resolvase
MSRYRGHRGRVDANQALIAEALRSAGVGVCVLSGAGDGIPDLLCANHERTWLMEVKTEHGELTVDQSRFFARWPGEIQLVRTVDDALATIRTRK